jgi:hypothetical protein
MQLADHLRILIQSTYRNVAESNPGKTPKQLQRLTTKKLNPEDFGGKKPHPNIVKM